MARPPKRALRRRQSRRRQSPQRHIDASTEAMLLERFEESEKGRSKATIKVRKQVARRQHRRDREWIRDQLAPPRPGQFKERR